MSEPNKDDVIEALARRVVHLEDELERAKRPEHLKAELFEIVAQMSDPQREELIAYTVGLRDPRQKGHLSKT